MSDDSLTVAVLREIRTEMRTQGEELRGEIRSLREELRQELHGTNSRLDETNVRLEGLERRQMSTEMRLATELTSVVGAIRELRDIWLEDRGLRKSVANHEQRIGAIETELREKRPKSS